MSADPPELPAPRVQCVLGTPLLLTTYEELARRLTQEGRRGPAFAVDFSNTQIVTMRRHEPEFRRVTRRFRWFIPDGMPLIWCLNRAGAGLRDRVYGPTFLRRCAESSPATVRHYFLGGSEACVTALCARLREVNPALNVAGFRNGYFRPADEDQIVAAIRAADPDILWIGLGTPKQQEWIERNLDRLPRGAVCAVGFAFDVNAGTKPDAPAWMQRLGLTWLCRLLSEPARLGPRYLKYNSLFLSYVLWDGLRGRLFAPPTEESVSPS
jgi:N-acetylglucosaminyldiphosphoundecaprenol N-acetyl-beta-D-mannosaminyltransferase